MSAPAMAGATGAATAKRLKVLAAMSGGVDSGVAAALLAEQGHQLTGVTLKLWCYGKSPVSERACCTIDAIEDARGVARRMGFPHFVVEAEEVFRARVLQPFLDDYANGRTPYPCALCNQHLKFGDLVSRMKALGSDVLCTGHYARIELAPDGSWGLFRARDTSKDQSYALALMPYDTLPRVRFPLGALEKREAREHGRRLGLSLWDKPESQDLCFVPDGDYAGFMEKNLGETRGIGPGEFVDTEGRTLGKHRGVIHYTVGQRKGLGLSAPEPLYVLGIDAAANRVTLGRRVQLESLALVTTRVNWLIPAPPAAGTRVHAKIRYQHAPAAASLAPRDDGGVEVRFDAPQTAIAPGQLCVLYDGDRVLGGASIVRSGETSSRAPEDGERAARG